jgi:signal transduction histidine kinase
MQGGMAHRWTDAEAFHTPSTDTELGGAGIADGEPTGHVATTGAHHMGQQIMGSDMWARMGIRFVVADAVGDIVADTGAADAEASPVELMAGTQITVGGQSVGTFYALKAVDQPASIAGDFLAAVRRSVWLATGAAGMLALFLGLVLFRQIVAPIRQVTAAAQAMAAGNLDQRVDVRSRDEVGQLAGAFNQMAGALVRQQELRRNLIADVAHELRTPLSVIQGNLEAMLDGVLPAEPEEIASLYEETILLTRLVGDLRLLSVAEAGQLTLERRPAKVDEVLQRAVELMRHQAEANQVTLTVEPAPDLPVVQVDVDRVGQVLTNLLQNALRHTSAMGQIRVAAEAMKHPGGASEVVVSVADTGSGISAEDLPYVFDRFYRADKSRTRASGGTGIGLALAKQLVEAHSGRIWVESIIGQGSTFYFTLPAIWGS